MPEPTLFVKAMQMYKRVLWFSYVTPYW